MTHRREQGFTLLELMIVVGIIAMIASIAIMAYVNSLDRARQKRTMSDMRAIATAWEARATELRSYGVPGFEFPTNGATYEDLNEALVPTYSRNLPQNDGWGRPYEFATGSRPKDYAIRSAGRDGVFEEGEYVQGETQHPDCDVVYANGAFIVYPGTLAK
ncbi:MAG TPA: prepilin-type N-terminal cleavage/methylation domain-containing protein [Thermoanaerobaculia bacterium]|nr:prepilin-type N-terminal cleavage/methylation domain-containing protein [Thermoanaerobaculia bacterium]